MWLVVIFLFVDRIIYRISDTGLISGIVCKIYVYCYSGRVGFRIWGIRAYMEDGFDSTIFATGFVVNALLAAGLAYLGDSLGVDLYLAAVLVFGVRLFPESGDNSSISHEKY